MSLQFPGSFSQAKLPKVWSGQIRLWLLHVENLFQLHGIESQTQRFQLAVCALEDTHLQRTESAIVSPPLVDPYDVIKDKLLSIYDTSKNENLSQLLHGVCLGDRLPSEMLSHMQRLGGNNVGTGCLRKYFLRSCLLL